MKKLIIFPLLFCMVLLSGCMKIEITDSKQDVSSDKPLIKEFGLKQLSEDELNQKKQGCQKLEPIISGEIATKIDKTPYMKYFSLDWVFYSRVSDSCLYLVSWVYFVDSEGKVITDSENLSKWTPMLRVEAVDYSTKLQVYTMDFDSHYWLWRLTNLDSFKNTLKESLKIAE